jgi:hypothetical protein
MKMSEFTQTLLSNLEEYEDKDVFIAKNLLINGKNFTYIPTDFKIFYDNRNDKVILVEKKDSYFFD